MTGEGRGANPRQLGAHEGHSSTQSAHAKAGIISALMPEKRSLGETALLQKLTLLQNPSGSQGSALRLGERSPTPTPQLPLPPAPTASEHTPESAGQPQGEGPAKACPPQASVREECVRTGERSSADTAAKPPRPLRRPPPCALATGLLGPLGGSAEWVHRDSDPLLERGPGCPPLGGGRQL